MRKPLHTNLRSLFSIVDFHFFLNNLFFDDFDLLNHSSSFTCHSNAAKYCYIQIA